MTETPTWQILIATVDQRHHQLEQLLHHLSGQACAHDGQVQVLVDRDDGTEPVGSKRGRLLLTATADYVCFVDDDDWVTDDYVSWIMRALARRTDYVGFNVRYTVNGAEQKPVTHSLAHERWSEDAAGYYRGISHLNPIRRDAAVQGLPFLPGFGEDRHWAERVAATGLVQSEVYLPVTLYEYRYSTAGSLFAGGVREVEPAPELAVFPHVEVIQ